MDDLKVAQLLELGIAPTEAFDMLMRTNFSVERAIDLYFGHREPQQGDKRWELDPSKRTGLFVVIPGSNSGLRSLLYAITLLNPLVYALFDSGTFDWEEFQVHEHTAPDLLKHLQYLIAFVRLSDRRSFPALGVEHCFKDYRSKAHLQQSQHLGEIWAQFMIALEGHVPMLKTLTHVQSRGSNDSFSLGIQMAPNDTINDSLRRFVRSQHLVLYPDLKLDQFRLLTFFFGQPTPLESMMQQLKPFYMDRYMRENHFDIDTIEKQLEHHKEQLRLFSESDIETLEISKAKEKIQSAIQGHQKCIEDLEKQMDRLYDTPDLKQFEFRYKH
ncbi:hypothetical protein EDD86DRAFT_50206 [Gorgonomyces haynaldii]|nr:hypothetical protein EDD86DRAFT_50206 [Gorgonomyces haynaldii]